MKFSIIIPTCDRVEMLSNCLDRLAPGNQSLSFKYYEVIVTDDSSSLDTFALINLKFPWVRWVKGPKAGPAANRNFGSTFARNEWLVFTDDDCLPDSQWLLAYSSGIQIHSGVKVFEGRTYANIAKSSYNEFAPINSNGNNLFSCNLCIERYTFCSIGCFDESFLFSYEDVELAYRLKNNGIKHIFLKDASVNHPWRVLRKKNLWKNYKNQEVGILNLTRKYPELLRNYNSIFFLKELPVSLVRDFIPKIFRYRLRGGIIIAMHILFHIHIAFKLAKPTAGKILRLK